MHSDEIQNNKIHLIGKLTASLIHEIRNPLSVIKLNLDLIKMEDDLSSDVLDSVIDSQSAVSRIEYMADNLLSFARIVTHGKEHFNLNTLTETAIELLAVKATKYGVKIIAELNKENIQIYADQNKLLQVLLNLITNAIESCEENLGGELIVKTTIIYANDNTIIQWSVTDNGVGIDVEHKAKIFEDFFTSKENGTGLGLSVCKMLVDEQNAQIDFESELGVGTTFKITFDANSMRKLYETENSSNR